MEIGTPEVAVANLTPCVVFEDAIVTPVPDMLTESAAASPPVILTDPAADSMLTSLLAAPNAFILIAVVLPESSLPMLIVLAPSVPMLMF